MLTNEVLNIPEAGGDTEAVHTTEVQDLHYVPVACRLRFTRDIDT
jgi:hypothetical protein